MAPSESILLVVNAGVNASAPLYIQKGKNYATKISRGRNETRRSIAMVKEQQRQTNVAPLDEQALTSFSTGLPSKPVPLQSK
jgi:hypothetical protein